MVKLYTRQSLHTTTKLLPDFSGARAKIWSNYTQDKAYILQHSYSKAPVELEPKFGQIIHKTKPTCTTKQLLQGSSGARAKIWSNYTQDKAYILQHSYSKAPVELEPKFGQIIHKTKPTCTTKQLLQGSSGVRTKIWSNFTTRLAYILQHSYCQTSVELEPKFGQIIHKTKPTYHNTATPRLQWS